MSTWISLTHVNVWWFIQHVQDVDTSLMLHRKHTWKCFSVWRLYIYTHTLYKVNFHDLKKKLPELASPDSQFLVLFRIVWYKERCSCSRFSFIFLWKERKGHYHPVIRKWRHTVKLRSLKPDHTVMSEGTVCSKL